MGPVVNVIFDLHDLIVTLGRFNVKRCFLLPSMLNLILYLPSCPQDFFSIFNRARGQIPFTV